MAALTTRRLLPPSGYADLVARKPGNRSPEQEAEAELLSGEWCGPHAPARHLLAVSLRVRA
jgi:hypothetical protein